ncbi:FGFR1 oncogene partner 2-like protein [Dinothrombium tinctorium]|uniref:FGFR1 oncogene partner 2-like protein n=1 Tax=Dinothrombium tinctorium TaxID=1965070 RepID=A0A3S3PJY5_9ACAR|nr:FGFR1 oncogene partner 2-like protein [Dinothrombium tinctorium]RWS03921.1 FGFR1 oncogene partner 2-like protein [Dinothrombium tinctorium]RWS14012.1 FGFR1 oncogene partner 2-like protein [Dinothrombium tinctorium]
MSLSIENIVNDAKKLASRLKEYETTGEQLLTKAHCLNKTVDSMKEYHEDMQALSSISQNRSRSSLIVTIQRESKQLRQLEMENKELKSALEEHQFALELIMSKYRTQVSNLIKSRDGNKCCPHVQDSYIDIITRQADKIYEMAAVMKKSVEVDDQNHFKDQQLLAQLRIENDGLREMLNIAKVQGSVTTAKEEKEVQTDFECDKNS